MSHLPKFAGSLSNPTSLFQADRLGSDLNLLTLSLARGLPVEPMTRHIGVGGGYGVSWGELYHTAGSC